MPSSPKRGRSTRKLHILTSNNFLKCLNIPLFFSKWALFTDRSKPANYCREIKNTCKLPTQGSARGRALQVLPSSTGQDGELGKQEWCSCWNTWQNTRLVQDWLHLACSLPSGFLSETRSRENSSDLKIHPATHNRKKETF